MQFLHTVLYTFPEVWQGEFVLQSIASLVGDHFLFFVTLKCDLGATTCIQGETRCYSLFGVNRGLALNCKLYYNSEVVLHANKYNLATKNLQFKCSFPQ